jgi:DNA-binding IclR family transcriptional regulator
MSGQSVQHLNRGRRRAIRYTAPALEKGLEILELLAGDSAALTRSEIAHRLRRTIGEVFRMLVCLDERGYICQVDADERYQLTLKFFELAHKHHPLQRLVAAATPLMHEVAETTGQSCHLAMLSHSEVIVVVQVDAPGKMGFAVRLGANIDLLDTASGHVILAFQKREVQIRILRSWRHRSGKRPPGNLSRHLDAIRHRGHEELGSYQVRGVVNVSFPVLNQQGEAVGALAVPYLQQIGVGAGLSHVKQALMKASGTLSLAIGGKRAKMLAGAVQV